MKRSDPDKVVALLGAQVDIGPYAEQNDGTVRPEDVLILTCDDHHEAENVARGFRETLAALGITTHAIHVGPITLPARADGRRFPCFGVYATKTPDPRWT